MNDENDDMPIDTDLDLANLDLLDSYLDDALAPAESAALLVRLAVDANLAATLDGLRTERAERSAVWASLEPDQRTVEQLVWRVRGAVAAERGKAVSRQPSWTVFRPDPWRVVRFTSAAAACVLLGFFGGRLGRGSTSSPLAIHDNVSPTSGFTPVASMDGPVEVPITDEYGQVITTQRFQNANLAHSFVDDLRRARDPAVSGPVSEGSTRLASELRY